MEQLKAKVPHGSVLLFEDESELDLNPTISKTWQQRGYQTKVTSPGINKRVCIFGAVEYKKHEVTYKLAPRKTGEHFQSFLYQLLARYKGKKIFMVLDNVSSHYTKRIKIFLERHKEKIQFVPLPTYAPQLNPIEPFWKFLKSKVCANHFHGNRAGIIYAVHQFFWAYRNGVILPFKFPK